MQQRSVLGIFNAVLGLVIAALYWAANQYFLFYRWWWMDVVLHFMGGLLVGMFVLWWLRFEVPISMREKVPRFLVTFFAVLLVGVGWEIFEKIFNIYGAGNYFADTASDIGMDIVGMLAAYFIFIRYVTK